VLVNVMFAASIQKPHSIGFEGKAQRQQEVELGFSHDVHVNVTA